MMLLDSNTRLACERHKSHEQCSHIGERHASACLQKILGASHTYGMMHIFYSLHIANVTLCDMQELLLH